MLLLAVVAQGREGEEIVLPETAVAVAGLALVAVVAAASACLPRSLGALLPSRRSENS